MQKEQFKPDGISTHKQGVIFSDSKTEEIEKIEFPLLVDEENGVHKITGENFDIEDIKTYLGGEESDTVRFVRGDKNEDQVVLCVLASSDDSKQENRIARAIAWKLKIVGFGGKVYGPAAFFPENVITGVVID